MYHQRIIGYLLGNTLFAWITLIAAILLASVLYAVLSIIGFSAEVSLIFPFIVMVTLLIAMHLDYRAGSIKSPWQSIRRSMKILAVVFVISTFVILPVVIPQFYALMVLIASLFLLVLLFFLGFTIVPENDVAIIQRLHRISRIAEPGFVWVIPVIESLHLINTHWHMETFEVKDVLTCDGFPLSCQITIRYRIDPRSCAPNFLTDLLHLHDQQGLSEIIRVQAEQALRQSVSHVALDDLFSSQKRLDIEQNVLPLVEQRLKHLGIKLDELVYLRHIQLQTQLIPLLLARRGGKSTVQEPLTGSTEPFLTEEENRVSKTVLWAEKAATQQLLLILDALRRFEEAYELSKFRQAQE